MEVVPEIPVNGTDPGVETPVVAPVADMPVVPSGPDPIQQAKELAARYATQRDQHSATAAQFKQQIEQLRQQIASHEVAAHQFAGAYDGVMAVLAMLEKAGG